MQFRFRYFGVERLLVASCGSSVGPLGSFDERVVSQEVPDNNFDGLQICDEDLEQLELPVGAKHSDLLELPREHLY